MLACPSRGMLVQSAQRGSQVARGFDHFLSRQLPSVLLVVKIAVVHLWQAVHRAEYSTCGQHKHSHHQQITHASTMTPNLFHFLGIIVNSHKKISHQKAKT
jgi:hypothetical protein